MPIILEPKEYVRVEPREERPFFVTPRLKFKPLQDLASMILSPGKELDSPYNSTDTLGRPYIGNINWEQAMRLTLMVGSPLSLRDFRDHYQTLDQGRKRERNVYDREGNLMDAQTCERLYQDLAGRSHPWRAEWFGTRFQDHEGILCIELDFRLENNMLVPRQSEPIATDVLTVDGYANMSSLNHQGLPINAVTEGVFFWYPRSGAVAGFSANADRVFLYCGRDPRGSGSGLGVRAKIYAE